MVGQPAGTAREIDSSASEPASPPFGPRGRSAESSASEPRSSEPRSAGVTTVRAASAAVRSCEGEGKGEGEAAAVDSPAPSGLLPSLEAWAAEQPRYVEELAFLRPHAGGKYPSLAPLHAAKEAWEGAADALVLARSATKLRKPPPGAAEKAEEALASVHKAAAALRAERAALDEVAELHFPELPLRIRAAGFDVSEEEIAEAFGAEGL